MMFAVAQNQQAIENTGPDPPNNVDCWEVLSSVGSVVSLGTEGITYADAVKLGCTDTCAGLVDIPTHRTPQLGPKWRNLKKLNVAEDVIDKPTQIFQYDAFFVMEGVKYARGGRTSLMFKGNQRTQKPRKKQRSKRNRKA